MGRVVRVKEKEIQQPAESRPASEDKMKSIALEMVTISDQIGEKQKEMAAKVLPIQNEVSVLSLRYNELKQELLDSMRKRKKTEMVVDDYNIFVKSKTTTEIDPKDLFEYFKKRKDVMTFFTFVSVRLTDAKKFIGEAVLKDFWKQDTLNYTDLEIRKSKDVKTRVKK